MNTITVELQIIARLPSVEHALKCATMLERRPISSFIEAVGLIARRVRHAELLAFGLPERYDCATMSALRAAHR